MLVRSSRRAAVQVLATLAVCGCLVVPGAAADRDSKVADITFDDIKFDIEKDGDFKRSMLTEKIEDLHESRVRLRGYILPTSVFRQSGIKQFVLVRDNMECCFGPGAALYDAVMVEMDSDSSTSFTTRPVAVEGVFTIKPYKGPDGKHLAIYHIRGTAVK